MTQQETKHRHRANTTSRSLVDDLKALGWHLDYRQSSRIALTLEALIGELAALVESTDANRSVPTDKGAREGRGGVLAHEMPMPNFDPAHAANLVEVAEKRLWFEYERLASQVRRPQSTKTPMCRECGNRATAVDAYCVPCGGRILKAHRRGS